MGIIHSPRVLAAIAKGLWRRQKNRGDPALNTLGLTQKHVYEARVGVWDYALGHLNNAAYLSHGEYARWQMTAENGVLEQAYKVGGIFVVGGCSIRYRREIKPFMREFVVDTLVPRVDDKHVWLIQNFRHKQEGDEAIRAQMLVRGLIMAGRTILNPRDFLLENCGVEADLVEELYTPANTTFDQEIERYIAVEDAQKASSAADDEQWRFSK